MKKIIMVLILAAGFCFSGVAQANLIAELKKARYEFAIAKRCLKVKGGKTALYRKVERDMMQQYLKAARKRFKRVRYAFHGARSSSALRTWRWNNKSSSTAQARIVVYCKAVVKRADSATRINMKFFAWLYDEVFDITVFQPRYLGYIPVASERKVPYSSKSVRTAFKVFYRKIANRQINFMLYVTRRKHKTRCDKHLDCGARMLACDASSKRCRKKRTTDLTRLERANRSRRPSCSSSVGCYADEECRNGVCKRKEASRKAMRKCKPNRVMCKNGYEWQCRSDGSSWYSRKKCKYGCSSLVERCSTHASHRYPHSRVRPRPPVDRPPATRKARPPVVRPPAVRPTDPRKPQPSQQKKKRLFVGFELQVGGVFLGDAHLGRWSMMGGFNIQLQFYTKVGVISVGGGWSGGGIASFSPVHEALQGVVFAGLWYRNYNIPWVTIGAGVMWHEQRIPGDGVGYKQNDLLGPFFQVEGQIFTHFFTKSKRAHFVALRLFAGAVFPVRMYPSGTYLPTVFAPITVFGGLKGVWSSPQM